MAAQSQITFDHILIRVDDLAHAVKEFESCGFNVHYGNAKKNCHHAMIYFQDGTFLELVDPSKFPGLYRFLAKSGFLGRLGTLFQRFALYALSPNRLMDFAVLVPEIEKFHGHKRALKPTKLLKMKRKNHAGQTLRWELFAFKPLSLPFAMSAYTPIRLPEPHADQHTNGVLGIQQMQVSVGNVSAYLADWEACFNILPDPDHCIPLGPVKIKVDEGEGYQMRSLTLHASEPTKVDLTLLNKYCLRMEASSI